MGYGKARSMIGKHLCRATDVFTIDSCYFFDCALHCGARAVESEPCFRFNVLLPCF